ncbi:MAG: hypothetical protein V1738_00340 [Patescibacteria group bacterium]
MQNAIDALDLASTSVDRLGKWLARNKTEQIGSSNEKETIKEVARSWLHIHRQSLKHFTVTTEYKKVDDDFLYLLEMSDKRPSRKNCIVTLKGLKQSILALRKQVYSSPPKEEPATGQRNPIPNFSAITNDQKTQEMLILRWKEAEICIDHGATYASVFMMGSLLETLFMARVNKHANPTKLYSLKSCPKDKKGNPVTINKWDLNTYIEVSSEMKWITTPSKDISHIIRDYRNLIHPGKEMRSGNYLTPDDAEIFWFVVGKLANQLMASLL